MAEGVTETGVMETGLALPEVYRQTPLRALRMTSRKKLAQYLNLDGTLCVCGELDIVNNYNGLAELIGFTYVEIKNFMMQKSPTEELLDAWTIKDHLDPTIGSLWNFLQMMERFDVMTDCKKCILKDAQAYYDAQEMEKIDFPIQDPEVSHSDMDVDETRYATVHDVNNQGEQLYYDAFVCYNPEKEDLHFVRNMIRMLESQRHNIKLFVPGRDDLPGSSQYTINAYLIEKRCRRVVIIMSKAFQKSSACEFQVKFAHALAPGARSKKLIPIILDKSCQMPRILKFLTVCDFTKDDMEDWVWDRLASAIKAPIVYMPQEEKFNDTEKLKDIYLGNKDGFEESWRQEDMEESTSPPKHSFLTSTGSNSSSSPSSGFTNSEPSIGSQSEAVYRRTTSSDPNYVCQQPSVAPERQQPNAQTDTSHAIRDRGSQSVPIRKSGIGKWFDKIRKPSGSPTKSSPDSSSTDGSRDDKDKNYFV